MDGAGTKMLNKGGPEAEKIFFGSSTLVMWIQFLITDNIHRTVDLILI